MFRQSFFTAQDAFEYWYGQILEKGQVSNGTKMLTNVSFVVRDLSDSYIHTAWRKWKKEYADEEWDWYLFGDRNIGQMAKYGIWQSMVDDKNEVNSNYGWHWRQGDQFEFLINELSQRPGTRRAFLSHWDYWQLENYKNDTPCNVGIHFQIIDFELHATVFCRSQDLWYGFCNDQYQWVNLMNLVKKRLGDRKVVVGLGSVHYFISNLHLYSKHWDSKRDFYSKLIPTILD